MTYMYKICKIWRQNVRKWADLDDGASSAPGTGAKAATANLT